ncbi:iron permease [Laetiporus sulphureus 93-53]|uniref:Iron permease n=1 Tax=Laetiporus sulphureus 93-53 TaxID=1314785 RepID=A0A165HPE1_9APHY|nr:iron permease [Laetiporus sulphureus 93-53]KZT12007.1 iron permease [Laetiporus sulphureus 93-53]
MEQPAASRGISFWLVIAAVCTSLFCGAMELTAVSTALPTIVNAIPFDAHNFVWVGSAYALSSTAFIPMSGNLAQIFGRKPIMLFSISAFAVGSLMCAVSPSQRLFISGRTVQGLGGGGILSLTNIILADLVPLRERGIFNGFIGMTWSIAAAIGPVIGGALAQHGVWRWLFYMNLPICGVAIGLVLVFLRLRTPRGEIRDKLSSFDWLGNFLVTSGSCAIIIALAWGGGAYPWSSYRVLIPLCTGCVGLVVFLLYEASLAPVPIIRVKLLSNRTTLSGYMQMFLIQAILVAFIYYMPVYFQACKDASPTGSGVDLFGLALTLSPISIVGGISITVLKRYRPQLWLGWCLTVLSMGLLSTLRSDSPRATSIGFGVISGAGIGTAYTGTFFPVLAPLPVSENAHAIALGAFLRAFAQVWGVAIGAVVLQNELRHQLPAAFLERYPDISQVTYTTITQIRSLPEPLKNEVRVAFASSLRVVWLVLVGMSVLGLVVSFLMRGLPLHTDLDQHWGVQEADAMNAKVARI